MIRKLIFLVFFLQISFLSLFAQSQMSITYSKHAMHEGDVVVLRELDTLSVGTSGVNKVWDFSKVNTHDIKIIKYNLNETAESASNENFFACDINGERTSFYGVSETQKTYAGFSNANGTVEFNQPVVELKYPFQYNSQFSGSMNGKFTSNNGLVDSIIGDYSVMVDAVGTLILPGVVLKNVLRVKYVQDYYQACSGTLYHILINRYVFYSCEYRYPVLQIKDATITCDCACNSRQYSAYLNESVNSQKKDKSEKASPRFTYNVYPNPFEGDLRIDYNIQSEAKVKIRVLDLLGKEVKVLVNSSQEQGAYNVSTQLTGVHHGSTYILEMKVNDVVYSEKVIGK